MASELRSIELSVDYRIWQILRQNEWCVPVTGMAMTAITDDPVTELAYPPNTYISEDGMPWCFLDEGGDIDTSSIKVYVGGVALDPSQYYVRHLLGQVVLNTVPTGLVTADALVSAVHVVEGYPDDVWLKNNDLPAVAWFNNITTGESFHVGTILEDRSNYFTIDVLANSPGQLTDLMDTLHRFIVQTAWLDMSINLAIAPNGSANPNFNQTTQFVDYLRMQRRPRSEKVPPRIGGTEKERHRGIITFTVKHIS